MHYACVVLHRWLKEFLAIHFPFVKEKPVPSVLIVNSLTTVLHRSEEHSCPVWTTPRTYSQSHLLLSVVPFVLTRMLTTLNMIKLGHAYSLKCGLSSPKQTRITPAFFFAFWSLPRTNDFYILPRSCSLLHIIFCFSGSCRFKE